MSRCVILACSLALAWAGAGLLHLGEPGCGLLALIGALVGFYQIIPLPWMIRRASETRQ